MVGKLLFAWRVIVEAAGAGKAFAKGRIGESMVDPKAIALAVAALTRMPTPILRRAAMLPCKLTPEPRFACRKSLL
jgi:hypothetical protein